MTDFVIPPWTMCVRVLSTAHMPGTSPDTGNAYRFDSSDCPSSGFIVYIEEPELLPDWLLTIAKHLSPQGYNWVRFDPAGDKEPGLPVFDWS